MSIVEGEYQYDEPDFFHDHCRPHGVFIGDPYGPDYMCQLCESGLDQWVDDPEYTLYWALGDGAPIEVKAVKPWRHTMLTERDPSWTYKQVQDFVDIMWNHDDIADEHKDIIKAMHCWVKQTDAGYWTTPTEETA